MTTEESESITVQLTITAEQGAPRVPLTLSKNATPTDLRKEASKTTKIPLTALKLIFRGRLIGDDDSKEAVPEFKLEDGSVLHCMGKPLKDGAGPSASSNTVTASSSSGPTVSIQNAGSSAAASQSGPIQPTSDPVKVALQSLRSHNPPKVYETAVTTLQKILHNIVESPLEEKYRRVKKQNAAFQRRLGGLNGGDSAMKAAGFLTQVDDGEEVYFMHASAEAWPQLLAARAAVEEAAREATVAGSQPSAPPQPIGVPGMMPNMPPGMQAAMSNLMSDPNQLQALMQNPMVQQAMRNDPRMANDPMMQQAMQEISNNPALLSRVSQMMRDPSMMNYMQGMMQAGGNGAVPPAGFPSPFAGMGAGVPAAGQSRQNTSASASAQGGQQVQPSQSDEDMTEEEMIAEAIRRSLQDG